MANPTMDLLEWLRKRLEEADADLLKEMVGLMAEMLMDAEVTSICGADYRERSEERKNSRNGHRPRPWDTRVGTIDLEIPKPRRGSYFPAWLLEPRRRAEKALLCVIADAWLAGGLHEKGGQAGEAPGMEGISRSQVSRMAQATREMVASFRNRPLDSGPYTYLWLDALTQKGQGGRQGGECVLRHSHRRERGGSPGGPGGRPHNHRGWGGVDGLPQGTGGPGALRGISGHLRRPSGPQGCQAACLPGATFKRCRTHFARNLLCRVPKASQDLVATCVRSIFAQPEERSGHAQHSAVVEQLTSRFPEAAEMLAEAREDILAFASFPKAHWLKIWSNNPLGRLNREVRMRTDVVGIFPNRSSVIRLVGAVLSEQHDEWMVCRRYMSLETLAKARMEKIEGNDFEAEENAVKELVPAAV